MAEKIKLIKTLIVNFEKIEILSFDFMSKV